MISHKRYYYMNTNNIFPFYSFNIYYVIDKLISFLKIKFQTNMT